MGLRSLRHLFFCTLLSSTLFIAACKPGIYLKNQGDILAIASMQTIVDDDFIHMAMDPKQIELGKLLFFR